MIIENCSNCSLSFGRKNIVQSSGVPAPKFMFIGYTPSLEEEFKGNAYTTHSGLGRILASIIHGSGNSGIPTYMTHIVKCRPQNGRPPSSDEVQACMSHLVNEINTLDPTLIIAVGKDALSFLTGCELKYFRGHIVNSYAWFGSRKVMGISDLLDLMKNKNAYSTAIWDLSKLKVIETWPEWIPSYVLNPARETGHNMLETWYKDQAWVAVDIETTGTTDPDTGKGLNPYADEIVGIAFSGGDNQALHWSGKLMWANWDLIKDFLEKHDFLIYQNNLFDRAFLALKGIKSKLFRDPRVSMYSINSDAQGFMSLDYFGSLYTRIPPYKHVYKINKGVSHLSEHDLGFYNSIDVDITQRIAHVQEPLLNPSLITRLINFEDVALDMRLRGVKADKGIIAQHFLALEPKIRAIETNFLKYGVNVSSPKQKATFLFNTLKLPVPPKAKKGKTGISVDKHVLQQMIHSIKVDCPEKTLLEEIIKHGELQTLASTYCRGTLNSIQKDGRVHPDWKPQGTDTGRWACGDPNMQNFPKPMRDIMVPEEGKIFLGGDYDRLEIWVAAVLSNEEELIDALSKNIDFHEMVRAAIAEHFPTITRLIAKTVVFGTFYGRSTRSIAEEFYVTPGTVAQWQDLFFNRFRGLKTFFQEKLVNGYNQNGYLDTMYGRRKYMDKVTQAMNFPIQSTASDIVLNASHALYKAGFNTVINVHDQLVCEEMDDSRKEEFKELMETSSPEFYPRLPVEILVGKNWKEV